MAEKIVRTLVLEPQEAEALERFTGDVLNPASVEDIIVGLAMMQISGEGGYVPDDYVNRLARHRPNLIK